MAFEQTHPTPTVPPADSVIDDAIAEVDGKLSAWTAAMHKAAALAGADAEGRSATTASEAAPEAASVEQQAADDARHRPVAIEPSELEQNAEPANHESGFLAEDEHQSAKGASSNEPLAQEQTAAASDGAAQPAEDDEEALLATLDDRLRAMVQLKRRWAGERRSLHELVEEARRASPTQMAQIRRWRSRS